MEEKRQKSRYYIIGGVGGGGDGGDGGSGGVQR
jgi:hypothetical protein